MGAIDEASIKQLSFITQLAKSVHIRSDGHDEVPSRACATALSVHHASIELPVQASDFEKCFPHFLWVLRDFALKVGSERRADNSRGPGGPMRPLCTPLRTPRALSRPSLTH